jgi:hypothetical protein
MSLELSNSITWWENEKLIHLAPPAILTVEAARMAQWLKIRRTEFVWSAQDIVGSSYGSHRDRTGEAIAAVMAKVIQRPVKHSLPEAKTLAIALIARLHRRQLAVKRDGTITAPLRLHPTWALSVHPPRPGDGSDSNSSTRFRI